MLYVLGKRRQSLLAVYDLRIEELLVVLLDSVPGQIIVIAIAGGDGSARQHIINASVEARPFSFGG